MTETIPVDITGTGKDVMQNTQSRHAVIIEGQYSVYWYVTSMGQCLDQKSMELLGNEASAKCKELGIVTGVIKSRKEIRPSKKTWTGWVRTYPTEILESLTFPSAAAITRLPEITMSETIPVYIKADDVVILDTELPAEAIQFEIPAWTCPVCGLNRGKGNHQKCSKITQLKHQQEQAKKATKRT
jgi:hypothetical protein